MADAVPVAFVDDYGDLLGGGGWVYGVWFSARAFRRKTACKYGGSQCAGSIFGDAANFTASGSAY